MVSVAVDARTLDSAVAQLQLEEEKSDSVDAHPERRARAAYAAYEEREMCDAGNFLCSLSNAYALIDLLIFRAGPCCALIIHRSSSRSSRSDCLSSGTSRRRILAFLLENESETCQANL